MEIRLKFVRTEPERKWSWEVWMFSKLLANIIESCLAGPSQVSPDPYFGWVLGPPLCGLVRPLVLRGGRPSCLRGCVRSVYGGACYQLSDERAKQTDQPKKQHQTEKEFFPFKVNRSQVSIVATHGGQRVRQQK